ncbi:MAG TPA: hypothetical protein VJ063_11825 [Verrucomicrobiae bacterium]|nr:hypothetical protein [Verrucomicrobiae bacterium]
MKWRGFLTGVTAISTFCAAAVFVWPRVRARIEFYQLTGHFRPIERTHYLGSTNLVTTWNSDGFRLADGRLVQLPGFQKLPEKSDALSEVIKYGIELGTNDRVYGLVRVHHWCGNDPVKRDIVKVDVAKMLAFLKEGELLPGHKEAIAFAELGPLRGFSEWGWNMSDYVTFKVLAEMPDTILEEMAPEAKRRE